MIQKRNQLVFILFCTIAVALTAFFLYQKQKEEASYANIKLTFIDTEKTYEVGSQLEAYEFVKKTNAADIDYPKIKSDKVGERSFVYVAYDKIGNQKEFVLLLNFSDPIYPIIQLTTNQLEIVEGDKFNAKDYIKEAYDPIDGKLTVAIKEPKKYTVGTHIISYSIKDKNGNKANEKLTLVVKEKRKKEERPEERSNTAQSGQNQATEANPAPTPPIVSSLPAKSFLFVDGYTMPNAGNSAVQACLNYKGSAPGSCTPIYATSGEYAGMQYTP